jgi:hypothetical protein
MASIFMICALNCTTNFFTNYIIMSVNIFGAAAAGGISRDNFYIDQKFKTISTNLVSKLNKCGDSMTGNLNILLNGDNIRTFGVGDIAAGKSVSLLLGDELNQIRHNFGRAIKIGTLYGLKVTCPVGKVCQMGTQTDTNIFMANNSITGLRDPENLQDAATKNYVDKKRSYSTYIPILEANMSSLGFSASANASISVRFQPFGAFNNLNTEGNNGSWVAPGATGWLQIKCPEKVKIWRIALKARSIRDRDITTWNITASNDGILFTNLVAPTTPLLGSAIAPTFFNVTTNDAYQYYRLNITGSTGSTEFGIQVLQLYIIN